MAIQDTGRVAASRACPGGDRALAPREVSLERGPLRLTSAIVANVSIQSAMWSATRKDADDGQEARRARDSTPILCSRRRLVDASTRGTCTAALDKRSLSQGRGFGVGFGDSG
jgi:hypothetical protein